MWSIPGELFSFRRCWYRSSSDSSLGQPCKQAPGAVVYIPSCDFSFSLVVSFDQRLAEYSVSFAFLVWENWGEVSYMCQSTARKHGIFNLETKLLSSCSDIKLLGDLWISGYPLGSSGSLTIKEGVYRRWSLSSLPGPHSMIYYLVICQKQQIMISHQGQSTKNKTTLVKWSRSTSPVMTYSQPWTLWYDSLQRTQHSIWGLAQNA